MAHIICDGVRREKTFAVQWESLNRGYRVPYNIDSPRNFLPLCGTLGTSSGDVWSCHHLFDRHMFLLLPTMNQLEFVVRPVHPFAEHLPGKAYFRCPPYRRGLAARAKIALKMFSQNIPRERMGELVRAVDFGSLSSSGPAREPGASSAFS